MGLGLGKGVKGVFSLETIKPLDAGQRALDQADPMHLP